MKNPEIINKLKINHDELCAFFTKSEHSTLKGDIKKIQGLISNMHHMVSNDKIHPDNNNVIESFFKASESLLQNYHYRQNLAYDHSNEANTKKMSNMRRTLQDLSSFDSFLKAFK
jgi:hypothetical protein